MFWNNECKKLSSKLGFCDLTVMSDSTQSYFNKNIKFELYDNINSQTIKYKKVPKYDNTEEKNKLRKKLLKQEDTRFKKELAKTKNPSGSKSKKCANKKDVIKKHKEFLKKIEKKVNLLDCLTRTRRVKLNPNDDQVKTLKRWLNECDYVYNNLVIRFNVQYRKIYEKNSTLSIKNLIKLVRVNKNFPINHIQLRNLIIDEYTELYSAPFCVLSNTIKEFVTSVRGIFTKINKNNLFHFEMKKRNIFRENRTLLIDHKYLTKDGPYPTKLGSLEISNNRKKRIFKWIYVKKDFKIVFNKYYNKFYLHAPILVKRKEQEKEHKIIALDPGIRKFLVGYNPDHLVIIGRNIKFQIVKRLKKIDKLKSKMTKRKKRKWKYKRAISRHYKKISNYRDELHNKTGKYLCSNYERVMMTDFSSKQVSKKESELDPMNKRILQLVSHYKLRQKLKEKCEEYSSQYIEVDESYTSKTCGNCGNENKKSKLEKIKCEKCKRVYDRDVNASRNILIKNRKEVLK